MSTSKALQRYISRATTPQVFTEGEIMRGMRLSLHNARRPFREPEPDRQDQANSLLNILADLPRAITPEHAAKGLAWFVSMKKKDGTWRENNTTRELRRHQRAIIDDFAKFTFEGYYNGGNQYRDWYIPIYRVWSRNGDSFAYCYGAWQSGGGILTFE